MVITNTNALALETVTADNGYDLQNYITKKYWKGCIWNEYSGTVIDRTKEVAHV